MLIYILAGLYAVIVRKIALGRHLRIDGRHALHYGIVLLVGAFPISAVTSILTILVLPKTLTDVGILMRLIDTLISAAICIGLIYPFTLRQRRQQAAEGSSRPAGP